MPWLKNNMLLSSRHFHDQQKKVEGRMKLEFFSKLSESLGFDA